MKWHVFVFSRLAAGVHNVVRRRPRSRRHRGSVFLRKGFYKGRGGLFTLKNRPRTTFYVCLTVLLYTYTHMELCRRVSLSILINVVVFHTGRVELFQSKWSSVILACVILNIET